MIKQQILNETQTRGETLTKEDCINYVKENVTKEDPEAYLWEIEE